MSALNNLRKKGTAHTLEEDEPLAERVGSYPCLSDKTFQERKEKDVVENAWKKLLRKFLHLS